ncbi:MAG: hypothetical protein RLY97_2156 [Pseudomonadota bacterium]
MLRQFRLFILGLLALFALAAPVMAAIPARPDGPVLDEAGIIPTETLAQLQTRLKAYNRDTGRAVMVVTVTSLDDEDIASYANGLFHKWGIGGKDSDQGLLLLIAPSQRKIRIEVGYGLEEYFTDALSGRIIRETIAPQFRSGDIGGGINAGVSAIISQLDRDPASAKALAEAAEAESKNKKHKRKNDSPFAAVIWIILILGAIMIFGRRNREFGNTRRSGIDPGIALWVASEVLRGMSSRDGGSGSWGNSDDDGGGWGGFGGGGFGGGGASGDW